MVAALLMNIISGIPCIQPRPVKKLTTQLYRFFFLFLQIVWHETETLAYCLLHTIERAIQIV